jgi:hypothetical protein
MGIPEVRETNIDRGGVGPKGIAGLEDRDDLPGVNALASDVHWPGVSEGKLVVPRDMSDVSDGESGADMMAVYGGADAGPPSPQLR